MDFSFISINLLLEEPVDLFIYDLIYFGSQIDI